MIIEEAEKRYGKDMAMAIWDEFDLGILSVEDTPEGLDIADHEWERVYSYLI